MSVVTDEQHYIPFGVLISLALEAPVSEGFSHWLLQAFPRCNACPQQSMAQGKQPQHELYIPALYYAEPEYTRPYNNLKPNHREPAKHKGSGLQLLSICWLSAKRLGFGGCSWVSMYAGLKGHIPTLIRETSLDNIIASVPKTSEA